MLNILLVGSGGFIGSIMRYLIGKGVHHLLRDVDFPYGTLCANILGCLLIGFLGGLGESRQLFSPEMRLFLFLGLLGGFTTFSSFGYDTFNLARNLQHTLALGNILLQLGLGLAAVYLGHALSRWV